MSDFVEQLRADADEFACHGGDRVSIAKCLNLAADKIAELEAELRDYKQQAIDLQCEIELMAEYNTLT